MVTRYNVLKDCTLVEAVNGKFVQYEDYKKVLDAYKILDIEHDRRGKQLFNKQQRIVGLLDNIAHTNEYIEEVCSEIEYLNKELERR